MSKKAQDFTNVTLKPSQITKAMIYADSARDSLMIWGAPGIGKSEKAKEYADSKYPLRKDNVEKLELLRSRAADPEDKDFTSRMLADFESTLLDQDTNFIDFRLSQIDPSDLRGIPVPERLFRKTDGSLISEEEANSTNETVIAETVVVWAAPKLLKLPADWKGVILFDEINSAMPIIQAASYQLILDRCVGEVKIPDGAFIMAAGNREGDGGVTFPMATPLRDRMTHVEMVADSKEWVDNYAIKKKLAAELVAFINETGSKYFNTLSSKATDHAGGSTPRSWARVASYQKQMNEDVNFDESVFKAMVAGRVGVEIMTEYMAFIKNFREVPAVNDILLGTVKKYKDNVELSAMYFCTLNLVYNIIDLNQSYRRQTLSKEEWVTKASNFLGFLINNYDQNREMVVMALRTMLDADCVISVKEVPAYKDLMMEYKDMVVRARQM